MFKRINLEILFLEKIYLPDDLFVGQINFKTNSNIKVKSIAVYLKAFYNPNNKNALQIYNSKKELNCEPFYSKNEQRVFSFSFKIPQYSDLSSSSSIWGETFNIGIKKDAPEKLKKLEFKDRKNIADNLKILTLKTIFTGIYFYIVIKIIPDTLFKIPIIKRKHFKVNYLK
jgi:hypothetical protein